ncbi:MAG: flagellum-specific ATP synthase FliI, partial [Colwellia sp.]
MVDSSRLTERFKKNQQFIHDFKAPVAGRLVRVVGLTLEAVGVKAHVGSQCLVETVHGDLLAEIVGFAQDITYLMPEESLRGVMPGARVLPISSKAKVP